MKVKKRKTSDPLDAIINTVQFIPQNIGKMFQQAEQFTRENILPFVNNLTPKFITDILAPREKQKYIPLSQVSPKSKSIKLDSTRITRSRNFNPPPRNVKLPFHESTTPETNIQKIGKRSTKRISAGS